VHSTRGCALSQKEGTAMALNNANKNNLQLSTRKWWKKNISWLFLVGTLLLVSAGKVSWTAAWFYLGAILLIILINAFRMDPELMAERAGLQEGTAKWDLYLSTFVALAGPLITALTAGFDQRYGWTGAVATWQQVVALVLFLAAGLLGASAMEANRYFSATVRLQSDRGHKVAKEGPYKVIRHPGYTAGIISIMATPVLLESWFALIPASLVAAGYIVRTALEDSFLQKNLPGYRDYASTVQYRLIPGVW
jgi:protein-S-isoprenylcysteine O-methyltransferase Ste14